MKPVKIKSQKESVRKQAGVKSAQATAKVSSHAALSTLQEKYFLILSSFLPPHVHNRIIYPGEATGKAQNTQYSPV